MQLHNLKRSTKNHKKKYVGRGGRRGKTSGRGTKGQNARSGRKKRPELRDIIKKLPKMRGRGKSTFKSINENPQVLNLREVDKAFYLGEQVSPQSLIVKGLISKKKGRVPKVKILGSGVLSKKLSFSGCLITGSCLEKIKAAGGEVL